MQHALRLSVLAELRLGSLGEPQQRVCAPANIAWRIARRRSLPLGLELVIDPGEPHRAAHAGARLHRSVARPSGGVIFVLSAISRLFPSVDRRQWEYAPEAIQIPDPVDRTHDPLAGEHPGNSDPTTAENILAARPCIVARDGEAEGDADGDRPWRRHRLSVTRHPNGFGPCRTLGSRRPENGPPLTSASDGSNEA